MCPDLEPLGIGGLSFFVIISRAQCGRNLGPRAEPGLQPYLDTDVSEYGEIPSIAFLTCMIAHSSDSALKSSGHQTSDHAGIFQGP